jgi:hypothetical protein
MIYKSQKNKKEYRELLDSINPIETSEKNEWELKTSLDQSLKDRRFLLPSAKHHPN